MVGSRAIKTGEIKPLAAGIVSLIADSLRTRILAVSIAPSCGSKELSIRLWPLVSKFVW